MKAYDLKNLEAGLQELAQSIKGQDIVTIAFLEKIDPVTVRRYLAGKVTVPALGKAILDRGRNLLLEKNAA